MTALILALIFRAFFVEPFIIPSRSMAQSLLGAHGTAVCPACGWEFDYGPDGLAGSEDATFVLPRQVVCANCHETIPLDPAAVAPKSGDRILVYKFPVGLSAAFAPRRWDVIVFRDPVTPDRHFIKRLIALPGEQVEIADGDVFINGEIARKPAAAQSVLWYLVFDQDHVPDPSLAAHPGPRWFNEAGVGASDGWTGMDARVIRFDPPDSQEHGIVFNRRSNGSRQNDPLYAEDFHAFNGESSGAYYQDARLRADVTLGAAEGYLRFEIVRGRQQFTLTIQSTGEAEIGSVAAESAGPATTAVYATALSICQPGRPFALEFGHLDYRVYLRIDGAEVFSTTDADYEPPAPPLRTSAAQPMSFRVRAAGLPVELRGLRIDRDVYYTKSPQTVRAFAGNPFQLKGGEYFVLGDNSPRSFDGRAWREHGPQLDDGRYRDGTVRADQIVGQAFFVYLPGLLPVDQAGKWRVPDIGRTRFIR